MNDTSVEYCLEVLRDPEASAHEKELAAYILANYGMRGLS